MSQPEYIPYCALPWAWSVDFAIVTRVLAVGIGNNVGRNQGMIENRIKSCEAFRRPADEPGFCSTNAFHVSPADFIATIEIG